MADSTQSQDTPEARSDRSLVRRLRAGSDDAATQIYLRYAERLTQLSRQQVGKDLAPRLDADDIVQSVFRTFFRRVRTGNYDVPDGEELWKLFLVIGLNKIRSAATYHRAAKRDVGATSTNREAHVDSAVEGSEQSLHLLKMTIDDVLSTQPESVCQIRDFLDACLSESLEILVELIRVDLEFRSERGCRLPLDEYRSRFPEAFESADAFNRIAFEDYRVRQLAGEAVSAREYEDAYGIGTDSWPGISASAASVSLWNSADGDASEHSADFPCVPSDYCGFTLLTELGRGSFSRVYLARQNDLASRFVVLKVSRTRFSDAEQLAQLQHGHIVPVYSVHRVGRMSVVCMPYFGAATLADLGKTLHGMKACPASGQIIVDTLSVACLRTLKFRGSRPADIEMSRDAAVQCELAPPVSVSVGDTTENSVARDVAAASFLLQLSRTPFVEAVLKMSASLADALKHAHERGLLHRDLKPANILLADDGRPMLLDFNLAISSQSESAGDSVGGTLPYMSPEQLRAFLGMPARIDERSDLYSLGVILYELLTGLHPFPLHRGSLETIARRMLDDRQSPSLRIRSRNASVTPAVEAIVRKCLEPNPEKRYRTAEQLREDLERHLADLPLKFATEPSLRERSHKWLRRHTRFTAVTTVGLLAGGFFLGAGAYRENERILTLEQEVESAMAAGQEALDDDDPELAQGRFLKAWMLVQVEPKFAEQRSSVAGWLDHARRATLERQMTWHVAPRTFELRRDEAILLAMRLPDLPQPQADYASEAVNDALEFTIANDPGWTEERRRLMLLAVQLKVAADSNDAALLLLDDQESSGTREWHALRSQLLLKAGRVDEAGREQSKSQSCPPDEMTSLLLEIVRLAEKQDFNQALEVADGLTHEYPQLFLGRFLKAICLWKLQRNGEAQVCLEACLAQRPDFLWNEYFLARLRLERGAGDEAHRTVRKLTEFQPSRALQDSLRDALQYWDFGFQARKGGEHP